MKMFATECVTGTYASYEARRRNNLLRGVMPVSGVGAKPGR